MTLRSVTHLLTTLALCAAACSAPQVQGPPPPTGPGAAYAAQCKAKAAKRGADIASRAYVPVDVLVHLWPSKAANAATVTYMSEVELAGALTATGASALSLKTTLIMARGGTGKTSLAESLEAQACGSIPFYRIDLNMDVVPHLGKVPTGVNPVAAALAATMGNKEPDQAEATIRAMMGDLPWVVVLDALDETPVLSREELARAIDDLVNRVAPHLHALVMTRPPVFDGNYGLKTVQGRLELPVLTCEQSDAWLASNLTEPEESKNFKDFCAHFGIDRRVTAFERCHYPHLSTYRDLQVVRALARNSMPDKNSPDLKGFQNSRAQVYTYFTTAQLLRDMQGVAWTPADAVATVDAMVAAKNPEGGARNLQFQLEECIAANPLPDAPDKHSTCERLLQSSIFKAGSEGPEVFHFANQSLGDLFLARWAAKQLVGLDGKADCARMESKAALLESNEVAGFLLGIPAGKSCALQVAQTLCKRGGYAQHIYEQFDQGLPSGKERVEVVVSALDVLQPQANPDKCVAGIFSGLAKTVEGLMPKQEAPADTGKGKKGKKTK